MGKLKRIQPPPPSAARLMRQLLGGRANLRQHSKHANRRQK